MANTIEIIITAQNLASNSLLTVSKDVTEAGDGLIKLGSSLIVGSAAIASSLAIATSAAVGFDQAMTNSASVLGNTRAEMRAISDEVLDMGARTTLGAQAAADAYYSIVGGVQDASTHMAILEASMATAEAGQANLTATTDGIIAAMNSYRYSAEQATLVSDIYTRTVAMGVGTMEDFVSQMSPLTGLMAGVDIQFQEVGASIAFMTTQGFNASQSATALRSSVTALLTPNTQMLDLLREIGFSTGEAALAELGLVGTMQALNEAADGSTQVLAQSLGSVEALNAAIALANPTVDQFFTTYNSGVAGATEAARNIQLESAASQLAMLASAFNAVVIEIGTAFVPTLIGLVEIFRPILLGLADFIQNNREVVGVVLTVVAALAVLGPVILGVGQAMQFAGAAATLLASPLLPLILIAAAIGIAFATNFGGIRDLFIQYIFPVFAEIGNLITAVFDVVSPLVSAIGKIFGDVFGGIMMLLGPFLDILLFVIRTVTALIQLLAGDFPGAMSSFEAAFTGSSRRVQASAEQMNTSVGTAAMTSDQVLSGYSGGSVNGGTSRVGQPVTLPYGNGISYSNPETQYAANLAALGQPAVQGGSYFGQSIVGSSSQISTGSMSPSNFSGLPRSTSPNSGGGATINVNVGETQLISRREAMDNGRSLGNNILTELGEGGSIGRL